MADTDSLDAFERMLVETLPPRELKWASEFLAELRNLRLRARSLESQLAELRTPKGAMENAQRVIRDAHIGVAQARDSLLTHDELIAQLDVYTEYGR